MSRYKAVLFDAYDTLWYPPASRASVWHVILADLGIAVTTEQVGATWTRESKRLSHQRRHFESSGHPNEVSAIESMWAASEKRVVDDLGLSVDPGRLREVAAGLFTANAELYPETLAVLTELRAMDMPMAMVSNGVHQEQTASRLGIDEYLNPIVGSLHVGFAKPSPEIFQLALSALGIGPEEAIMVGDDWGDDVLGASGVGMRGVHLVRGDANSPGSDAIKDLRGVIDVVS
jgi:HAD superfamily hydrolase (TIGR01509 family)